MASWRASACAPQMGNRAAVRARVSATAQAGPHVGRTLGAYDMDDTERFGSGEGPGEDAFARGVSGEDEPDDGHEEFDPFGSGAGVYGSRPGTGPGAALEYPALPAPEAAGALPPAGPHDFDPFGTGTSPGGAGELLLGSSGAAPVPAAPSSASGGSFDAFAAGAVRPSAADNPALPVLRTPREASLFESGAPVPKVTRPARDPFAPEPGSSGGSRVERVVAGDYLLSVNPVDGTEISPCPAAERPTPVRRTRAERTARMNSARPAPPPGPPAPELPLLERDEDRERLVRLLSRGRSVRVTGPSGSGRTSLLESVSNACADLAPEGVLRLSGYRHTPADLLQDLYALVYAGRGYRPTRGELPALLGEVGAVVILDDLEFGGAGLEELLSVAPECAFLMAATPDVPAPAADSMVEEVFLSGLTRAACVDLLQLAAGRPLEEDETAWAADLWFESEGLPLRFVQAGALLRQRDVLRGAAERPDWDDSVWEKGSLGFDASGGTLLPEASATVPLPSLAESAAPADLLASRLGESAREALAFAVALDGECPHASHLPALVGDTHGDAALGELTAVGLAVPVAAHFRLAAGVAAHLSTTLAADGDLTDVQAHTAALHYAWWTGHPSVTPERAAAESEAILAAMAACRDGGHASAAVLLARTVASSFAAALHWGAWERTLRIGQEAARLSGEVAEEAYFLHELGVLALCTGNTARARAELEASIALRGALADRQGTVVGRRNLALVNDVAGTESGPLELMPAPGDSSASPTLALPPAAVVISKSAAGSRGSGSSARRLAVVGSRRNLVAAGTGVVLAAVLGTIVTLGATSGGDNPDDQVKPIESIQQDAPEDPSTVASQQDGSSTAPSIGKPAASSSTTAPSGTPVAPTMPNVPVTSPVGGMTSPPGAPTTTHQPTHGGHPTTTKPTGTKTGSGTPSSPGTPTDTPSSPTDTDTGTPTSPMTQTATVGAPTSDPATTDPAADASAPSTGSPSPAAPTDLPTESATV